MWILIISIFLIMIVFFIEQLLAPNINQKEKNNDSDNVNLSKYQTNKYIMTQTELIFYRELKKVTDKLELTIFPQVDMERIINVIDNNTKDRNRIKSRSIDFSIVNNKNCKIVCCIELDDYTHNRKNVKKSDNFKNELFKKVEIPLYRIKVNKYYNLDEIENLIKSSLYEVVN